MSSTLNTKTVTKHLIKDQSSKSGALIGKDLFFHCKTASETVKLLSKTEITHQHRVRLGATTLHREKCTWTWPSLCKLGRRSHRH